MYNKIYWNITKNEQNQEVNLVKGVMKICSRFAGEHPCRSGISIKLQSNLIEITLRHGFSPVNLLHIFRTPLSENTSGWLLLNELTHLRAIVFRLSWIGVNISQFFSHRFCVVILK